VMKSLCKRYFRARMVSLAVRVSQGLCPDMSHDNTNFALMDIVLQVTVKVEIKTLRYDNERIQIRTKMWVCNQEHCND
jgi:hypothetical protein